MNTAAKERFDTDISRITIVGEVSPATVAVAAGEEVKAFYLLQVALKRKNYDERVIGQLPKLIGQHMLFLLECEGEASLAVYRGKLIRTDWQPKDSLTVTLKGLDLDEIWQNIIRDLEGGDWDETQSLDENIARHDRAAKLQREIARLEKLARTEKQPKKKFELVQRITELRRELNGKNC